MDALTGAVEELTLQVKILDDLLSNLADDFASDVAHIRLLIADIESELQQ